MTLRLSSRLDMLAICVGRPPRTGRCRLRATISRQSVPALTTDGVPDLLKCLSYGHLHLPGIQVLLTVQERPEVSNN
jgi:hypothetical protein